MSASHEEHQNLVKAVIDLTTAMQLIVSRGEWHGVNKQKLCTVLDHIQEHLEKMYTYDNTI